MACLPVGIECHMYLITEIFFNQIKTLAGLQLKCAELSLMATITFLAMPRCKLVTNLRNAHRSHTYFDEFVSIRIESNHDLKVENVPFI